MVPWQVLESYFNSQGKCELFRDNYKVLQTNISRVFGTEIKVKTPVILNNTYHSNIVITTVCGLIVWSTVYWCFEVICCCKECLISHKLWIYFSNILIDLNSMYVWGTAETLTVAAISDNRKLNNKHRSFMIWTWPNYPWNPRALVASNPLI